jgi:predicted SPOUT superfamily RNA methylase MTH1
MKQPINEIKRMQQLAGILNENVNEMRNFSKWAKEDITPEERAAMDKVIKAGNDKYEAERKAEREKKQIKTKKDGKDVEEGLSKAALGAALGATLALSSPKTATAQSQQGIENLARLSSGEIGNKMWEMYSTRRSTVNLEKLSPEVSDLISAAAKEAMEYGYPYEAVKKLGQAVKKDPAAMKLINASDEKVKAASMRGYGDDIEQTVNEALRKLRRNK